MRTRPIPPCPDAPAPPSGGPRVAASLCAWSHLTTRILEATNLARLPRNVLHVAGFSNDVTYLQDRNRLGWAAADGGNPLSFIEADHLQSSLRFAETEAGAHFVIDDAHVATWVATCLGKVFPDSLVPAGRERPEDAEEAEAVAGLWAKELSKYQALQRLSQGDPSLIIVTGGIEVGAISRWRHLGANCRLIYLTRERPTTHASSDGRAIIPWDGLAIIPWECQSPEEVAEESGPPPCRKNFEAALSVYAGLGSPGDAALGFVRAVRRWFGGEVRWEGDVNSTYLYHQITNKLTKEILCKLERSLGDLTKIRHERC